MNRASEGHIFWLGGSNRVCPRISQAATKHSVLTEVCVRSDPRCCSFGAGAEDLRIDKHLKET